MSAEPARRRITLTKSAAKAIQDLPEHVGKACAKVLREIGEGAARGKALKGALQELRSVRLGRSHRLLYRETPEVIQVVDIGPRGDVYKR